MGERTLNGVRRFSMTINNLLRISLVAANGRLRDSLESNIDELVSEWTLPLELVFFFSLFGCCACLLEHTPLKWVIVLAFLWPFISIGLWILLFPLFLGVFIALVPLISGVFKPDRKQALLSFAAFLHNVLSMLATFLHIRGWTNVYW